MATLMDQIMGRADQRDFTLGSRATFQPYNQPFSRDGRLGNMGMRNMLQAQQRLEATNIPGQPAPAPAAAATDTNMPVYDAMGNVISYAQRPAPYTPSPETDALQRQLNRVPFGPPMPANLSPPSAVAPVSPRPPIFTTGPLPYASTTTETPPAPQASPPPLPPVRPYGLGTPEPSVRQSFMDAILRGPAYQSNAMPVITTTQGAMQSGQPIPQSVNWGNPESAADFFRADQAARQLGLLG